MNKAWIAALVLPSMLGAQDISFNLFSSLAPKATSKVEVSLDGILLEMASKFMDDKDPEEAKVKGILVGLKGIYVRSFKFAKPGEFSDADVQAIRGQLKGWSQLVSVQDAEQNTGVFLKTDGKKIMGLVVLAVEPKDLTVVNIVGVIQPEQVRDLSGRFGIPELSGTGKKTPEKK